MRPIVAVTIVSILCLGCLSGGREQSQRARMLASSRAEADEEKKFQDVKKEEEREVAQAAVLEKSNPRVGCVFRVQAQHKGCLARADLMKKSFRSALQRMADPKACDDTLAAVAPACEALPSQTPESTPVR